MMGEDLQPPDSQQSAPQFTPQFTHAHSPLEREQRASRLLGSDWPQLVLESIRDFAILVMDVEGTIVRWNEGAENMFGYQANKAIGQNAAIIFTPEDRANLAHVREMATARATGRAADERWHLRKDQSRFYVSGVLTAIYAHPVSRPIPHPVPDGDLIGFVKVARDLTERVQAEEAMRQLNATLEHRVDERTEQIRSLVTELSSSEQAERRRISQILHDDLQQRLYSINFQLTALRYALDEGNGATVQQAVDEIQEALQNAVHVTRSLSIDLSPPILHQEGLVEAMQWLAMQFKQLHGLEVTIEADPSMAESNAAMNEDLRVLLFQTIRELLFNIVKHAGVTQSQLMLAVLDEQVQIQIIDGGYGFDINQMREQNSQGLRRTQQRMQLIGGLLDIRSSPGQGTHVILRAPLSKRSHS